MIARSYTYRIYPDAQQTQTLDAWQRACWEVYRRCVIQRRDAYQRKEHGQDVPLPTWASQGRDITAQRAVHAHWRAVPADTMSAVVKRVQQGMDTMIRRYKEGTPAYRKQHEQRAYTRWQRRLATFKRDPSLYGGLEPKKNLFELQWPRHHTAIGLQFRGNRGTALTVISRKYASLRLAGASVLGTLRVRYHRPIPVGSEMKQVHITRAADGWYVAVSCLIPEPDALPPTGNIIGVDIGCIHEGDQQRVAVVSDGRIYHTTDGLKRNAKRLATLQKLVSNRRTRGTAKHADPHSNRTKKRHARIGRLHQRITRQREHVHQYIAKRLVDTADVIAFEDLNHVGMRRKGTGRRKRGLNRSLSTAAPGALIALTQKKAEIAHRTVMQVDARYTSQICSACGAHDGKKALDVRHWTCAACGAVHDRDLNAAINIRKRCEGTL